MALAKNRKDLFKIIIGGLIVANLVVLGLYLKEKDSHAETARQAKSAITDTVKELKNIEKTNQELSDMVDYKVNTSSTIGAVRSDLVELIQKAVKERGVNLNNPDLKIDELDAMRALKSAENRVLDEYMRLTALVLATMNTESNFTYKTNTNPNGSKDYGIMQVNDSVIPYLKEALGENIDPINNKNHNVESGSWEIYDCYVQAKDKHPEDVIWWTYAYYNRGKYFENTDTWKNPKHPNYDAVHKQADVRSKIFKEAYEFYYDKLKEAVDNGE